ncbi:hypothetical protein RCRUDOLPH_84 [Rhodobacter phage RcRudolph]|nr:hypothetical protein RCRUDOLPH_84 [Rhodobacter phage RcRudolph]
MTTLSELNELRVANGKTELKAWKQSKAKLDEAIEAERQAQAKRLADEGEGLNPEDLPQTDETDPTMPMGENGNVLVDPIDEQPAASDLSDVEGQTETTEPAAELPLIPRGAIGAMSIELLTASDEPYESIVAKIVAKYPTAKTTARSLASVAMDLRRDGVEVPSRRKPAKAKVQAETAPQQAAEETAGE